MIQIARVLCPIDFSEASRHALDRAAAIAGWHGANLTVLNVFPIMPVMDLPPIALGEAGRKGIQSDMEQFTGAVPSGVMLDLRIEEAAEIQEEILKQARTLPADLLVLGSHGRSGLSKFVLGSIAEKVLRRAPCPVMIVPPRAPDTPPDKPVRFERILCAVDFSPASVRALEHAMALAEEGSARLTVLHAIEIPPEVREHPLVGEIDVDGIRAAAEADRLRRLRALVPDEVRTYCTVETAVREGAASREVLRLAAEQDSDLIVMGVQGRRTVDLLVFGSTTARVTRAATCPVLVIPQAPGPRAQGSGLGQA
jgi:nucleotide-binding universal stress UspA family protein